MKWLISVWTLCLMALSSPPSLAEEPLRLGVLAYRPKPQAMAQWQPLAAYLETRLGRRVELAVYSYPELNAAVDQKSVDVVLTNPGHFILLQQRSHLSPPLVTQIALERNHALTQFGGVIFVRSEDKTIQRLADLAGKRIAAVDTDSLGGYLMQSLELAEEGVALPVKDQLLRTGMPHDRAVEAVLSGQAEVGFARSGVIEAMVGEGKLVPGRLRILHPVDQPFYPFMTSTRLYPEWPVAVLPQVDESTSRQLAVALLSLPADSPAAIAGKLRGFTNPSDYKGVEVLLRQLRLPPFDVAPEFTPADMWHRYHLWIVLLAIGMILLLLMGAWLLALNHRVGEAESRLRLALDSGQMGVWDWNIPKNRMVCDEHMLHLFGLDRGVFSGGIESWLRCLHPEDIQRAREDSEAALKGEGRFEPEFRVQGPGGAIRYIKAVGQVLWNSKGAPIRMVGVNWDITERKQMELILQESEEEYRLLFNRSLDAILLSAPDGRILDGNPAACEMFGRSVEEIKSLGRWGLVDTSDPRLSAALEERARTGKWAGELTFLRRDGIGFPCEASSVIFMDHHGFPKTSIIIRDISERKQAEELQKKLAAQIQQSHKMDSLGSLAGGIAHDMNNILGAIQAVVDTVKLKSRPDSPMGPSLDLIDRAATRGRDLVKGLTNFTRKNLQEPEALDINALVKEEIQILSRTTLQKIDLVMDLEESLAPVVGERGSLVSAIMNICLNALDAMPAGGTLTMRTRSCPDCQVELLVEDDGIGMPPDVVAQAMDPFFTTKPIGKGTGLGLAMAFVTVKAHGGVLSIRSEEGRGTTVSLRLPATAAGLPSEAISQVSQRMRSAARILLVDDDELIREAVTGMLEALGHRAFAASGGAEALSLLDSGEPVELIILDLNMPGMNGLETHGHVRRRWPHLPILLATGNLDEKTAAHLKQDPRAQTITKPFTLAELNRKLLELMP